MGVPRNQKMSDHAFACVADEVAKIVQGPEGNVIALKKASG